MALGFTSELTDRFIIFFSYDRLPAFMYFDHQPCVKECTERTGHVPEIGKGRQDWTMVAMGRFASSSRRQD